jgi:integrase
MHAVRMDILSRIGEIEMRFQDPRVEKHGNHWRIRPVVPVVHDDGTVTRRQVSYRLGAIAEMTLSQAKQQKQEIMTTINAGKVVVQAQVRFGILLEKFDTVAIPLLAHSTRSTYRSHIRTHIAPAFAALKICEIDHATVQGWMNTKLETLSWNTRQDLKKVLSAIFSSAKDWKLWDGENPCEGLQLGKKRAVRKKVKLDVQALNHFLMAIPHTKILAEEGARLLANVALLTGARVSEVLGLKWGNINLKAGMIQIEQGWVRGHQSEGKSEAAIRENYIGPLVEDFRAWQAKATNEWVFPRTGSVEPADDRSLQAYVWRPAAEAVGIYKPGFGLHAFRRLNITLRQEVGASVFEAAKMAGHSKAPMTWIYTLTDASRERDQVNEMSRIMAGEPPKGRG